MTTNPVMTIEKMAMQKYLKNLNTFLSDDISHLEPTMRTLDFYTHSWLKSVTSDIEYEKGVQAVEYFKSILESTNEKLNEQEYELFGLLCSLQVLYVALKPCHEKANKNLERRILLKMDETRHRIQEIINQI